MCPGWGTPMAMFFLISCKLLRNGIPKIFVRIFRAFFSFLIQILLLQNVPWCQIIVVVFCCKISDIYIFFLFLHKLLHTRHYCIHEYCIFNSRGQSFEYWLIVIFRPLNMTTPSQYSFDCPLDLNMQYS